VTAVEDVREVSVTDSSRGVLDPQLILEALDLELDPHAGHQLPRVEGLDEIVRRPLIQPAELVLDVFLARQDDHGNVLEFQPPALHEEELEPVAMRHEEVAEHHVDLVLHEELESGDPLACLVEGREEGRLLQRRPDLLPDALRIVDDEAGIAHGRGSPPVRRESAVTGVRCLTSFRLAVGGA
jgi:hypothetical protein